MIEQWAQGGLGALLLAAAVKLLWPLVSKTSDAAAARATTDETLHKLYQETLKEMRQLSLDLSQARYEIARLKGEVEQLTQDLTEARKALETSGEKHGAG